MTVPGAGRHAAPAALLREVPATPWKAVNEIRRLAWLPIIRAYFALHGIRWGDDWRVYGRPLIQRHRGSMITLGSGLEMRNWRASNPLGLAHPCILATWSRDAVIEIADRVGMSGVTLCAATSVAIGHRVLLGANVVVSDTDFHGLDPDRRMDPGATAPIVIEDDVFVGMHAIVLKGVHIGRGAVVGAGSVVASDIPAGAVAAGNPARVVGVAGNDVAMPRS